MLTLKIENPEIEKIFLEGFQSNKESFYNFIQSNYYKMLLLKSLDTSCKQAKLQENGELETLSLDDLIDELNNHSHS